MTFETNKTKKMNPFKFVLIEGVLVHALALMITIAVGIPLTCFSA
jgi:hypothetical protein